MPFTNGSGSISFCLKHVGHGDAGCIDNELGVAGGDSCIFLSPGIHTCQQTEAGRGTGGRSGIGISELYTLSGKAVDIGGTYFSGAIATQVTDAQIVGNQVDNIRLLTGSVGGFFLRRISASGYQGCARKKGP